MSKKRIYRSGWLACTMLAFGCVWSIAAHAPLPVQAAKGDGGQATPEAVEDDMHEFMEYVFQPTYLRLREAMASEPQDARAWKPIKADSLILAEAANLLLFRVPEEDGDQWRRHSVEVRRLGGQLYRAAKDKNYTVAHEAYTGMLRSCNRCHDDFAGGEHQLKP